MRNFSRSNAVLKCLTASPDCRIDSESIVFPNAAATLSAKDSAKAVDLVPGTFIPESTRSFHLVKMSSVDISTFMISSDDPPKKCFEILALSAFPSGVKTLPAGARNFADIARRMFVNT